MPNAKDYTAGSEKILAVGTGGSGKTTGFLSLPGRKFIYIFDPSALETLRGHDVDYELFTPDILDLNAVTLKTGVRDEIVKPPEPRTYVEFEEHFEKMLRTDGFAQYDVIGFDSMTTFSECLMDRIMWLNGRFGKWPEQADWTATMNTTVNVLRTLVNVPKATIYVTAHVEFKQEGDGGKIQNVLSLIGRLRLRLPLLFSDIWLFTAASDAKSGTTWQIQTQPDRYNPFVRSTMRHLERIEDVTVDWNKPLKGQGLSRLVTASPLSAHKAA